MTEPVDYDRIYSDSFWKVTSNVIGDKDFFDKFYELLFASSPEIRNKFEGTDFFFQKKMLRDSLVHVMNFSGHKTANDFMKRLAARHSKGDLDIPSSMYRLWLSALIDTVKIYDPEFDDDVELAWRLKMGPGIDYMMFQYDK